MTTIKMRPFYNIDINQIRNKFVDYEIYMDKQLKEDKSLDLTQMEDNNKRTGSFLLYEDEADNNFNYINNGISQNFNDYELIDNSGNSDNSSRPESSNNNSYNISSSNQESEEKKFNSIRSNYYLKYKLYDFPYYQQELNKLIPEKYKINEKYYSFVYPDNYNTFYITKSRYLGDTIIINDLDNNKINFTKFDNSRGLYFCGKENKIENENKICAPNEFICKECMEINKKRYNIKDKYLININGRVAKINKGSYHCFGKFLSSSKLNQIEDCIYKFGCKACKLLDKYSNYYT